MNDKKSAIFYSFLCAAVFCLFCLWYFTSAEKPALYITDSDRKEPPAEAAVDEYAETSPEKIEPAEVSYDGLVNINTASAEELEALPDIGEITAERIIAYRDENGGFSSKEEIINVKGIGEKTYENIQNLICIE